MLPSPGSPRAEADLFQTADIVRVSDLLRLADNGDTPADMALGVQVVGFEGDHGPAGRRGVPESRVPV